MEVQVISKENVKPSSPTPPHLRTFKLSLLDQLIPSPYSPIIFFYPIDDKTGHPDDVPIRLELLKKSLSETLTHFYPLAGKIRDDLSIDCNDEGANFVETRVNCHLTEFLTQPDVLFVHQFLPCELVQKESFVGTYVTNVQANVFSCGSIVIGLCISHRILDGVALSTFLKAWTSAARGCQEKVFPDFIAGSLFPANDLWLRDSSIVMWGSLFKKGKWVTRRFVFDASAIGCLKAQVSSSGLKCPTRVETVSAFLWKCTISASEELHGIQRPSQLTHLVNLRPRFSPPLSEHSIGNLLWLAAAKYTDKPKPRLEDLVGKVREAISKIDDKFVTELKGDKGSSLMSKSLKEIGGEDSDDGAHYLGFSSWCNLGFYDTDFGWGKPVWVSSIGLSGSVFMNLVILVDRKVHDDDSIEAWVTLDEQEMAVLESNPDIQKFASLDPSPLL